jgi:hypothetical protein
MDIIKKYHNKKWILQFLNALYNSIDNKLLNDTQVEKNLFVFFSSENQSS